MTHLKYKWLVALIIVLIIMIRCSPPYRLWNFPTISSLNKLKYENDSIFLDFKIDIPRKTLSKKLIYVFKPIVIINNTDTIRLTNTEYYGEKIGEYPKVIYKYGGEFHHLDTIKLVKKLDKIRITEESVILFPEKGVIPFSNNFLFEGEIK